MVSGIQIFGGRGTEHLWVTLQDDPRKEGVTTGLHSDYVHNITQHYHAATPAWADGVLATWAVTRLATQILEGQNGTHTHMETNT